MIRYKQLITLNLIDKETKEAIGKILDVIYSPDIKKIDYIIIKNNNLIKNKAPIPYRHINFLNSNQALYLEDMEVLQEKLDEEIKNKFKIIDKEIRLEDGECVGYVKDIVINKEDGTIGGFIITEGLFEDLMKGRNYIPLLKNTLIKEDGIYMPYIN
ncbi:hypothetical protein CULT_670017 [[Clostridium] ultunense Esp]|uniref:PRC-barrel domain-containing protein n=1 Tax=[Clostridium] ultunense Esp TaxID=1288971 RepID=M1ZH05_9FIRM|nr:PRC-barrel domain-containing protein [Schnuerera ultunensis]CCQ97593.1 hypothetical protein CULT_670017 [[Clostridium] ultunense Esp]SHD77225.1 conserved protein of unknown function [[Clostridium] ultunense Esp]